MKRYVIALCALVTGLALAFPTMADNRRGSDGDRDYSKNYREHPGFRHRPYDRHRHYRQHQHRNYRYDYHGHWRSWDDFDHYMRRYPHLRRHGHYYHDGAHLMFRTCPPDTGMCFFFSIGR